MHPCARVLWSTMDGLQRDQVLAHCLHDDGFKPWLYASIQNLDSSLIPHSAPSPDAGGTSHA